MIAAGSTVRRIADLPCCPDGERGVVEHVSSAAPYAVVRFGCGMAEYIRIERLAPSEMGRRRESRREREVVPVPSRDEDAGSVETTPRPIRVLVIRPAQTATHEATSSELGSVPECGVDDGPAGRPGVGDAPRRSAARPAPSRSDPAPDREGDVETPAPGAPVPEGAGGAGMGPGASTFPGPPSSGSERPPRREDAELSESLALANATRLMRAKLRHRWCKMPRSEALMEAADLVLQPDEWARTWHAELVLQAIPWVGETKAQKTLLMLSISPRKTLGGLSPRQRHQLAAWLAALAVLAQPVVMTAADVLPADHVGAARSAA